MRIFTTLFFCFFIQHTQSIAQSGSRVELHSFYSPALEVNKSYNIYLPRGYDDGDARYPVVYFLRLHESEWFDPNLPGRNGATLKNIANALIQSGQIGEMILVGPSTGSDNGQVAGLFNLLRPDLTASPGIGTGRFEDYFIQDLISHIDSTYRTIPDRAHRGVDGFSLGGYTSIVLALRNLGVFSSVGGYDGTMMWRDLDDPTVPGNAPDDSFWMNSRFNGLIGPLFDVSRKTDYMLQHNAANIVAEAEGAKLDSIRALRFHIHTGHSEEVANLGRNEQLVEIMAEKGIPNTSQNLILAPNAVHDYHFADLHASKTLVQHWQTFQQATSVELRTHVSAEEFELLQNYPNPFNPETSIQYFVASDQWVRLRIFDVRGLEVATLVNEWKSAGGYTIVFEARGLPSGVYFARLQVGGFVATKKMLLLR